MSTNRYLNAGAPGAGTTVDNMASRVKAWANVNQTGTQAVLDSFNVGSITDGGVGVTSFNFAAPMLNGNYAYSAHASFTGFNFGFVPGTRAAVGIGGTYYDSSSASDRVSACVGINGTLA